MLAILTSFDQFLILLFINYAILAFFNDLILFYFNLFQNLALFIYNNPTQHKLQRDWQIKPKIVKKLKVFLQISFYHLLNLQEIMKSKKL